MSNHYLEKACTDTETRNIDFTIPKNVKSILDLSFNIKEENIEAKYDAFKREFYGEYFNHPQTFNRSNFVPATNESSFLDAFKSAKHTVGIDLPIELSDEKKATDKYVFIVGEDPLRFGNFAEQNNNHQIVLSTPYAPQHSDYRRKAGKMYWAFSLYLLENGFSIYYTDINKIWIGNSTTKKAQIPLDLQAKFKHCLQEEIALYNPVCIVTFGKPAEITVKEIVDEKHSKVVSFIHPTFSARKHWKDCYKLSPASNEAVLDIMIRTFANMNI